MELTGLVEAVSPLIITVIGNDGEEAFLPNRGDFTKMMLKDEVNIKMDKFNGTREIKVWRKGNLIVECTDLLPKPI